MHGRDSGFGKSWFKDLKSIYHIAIDGPAAAGKGTAARELSARLGIPALETGALYRGAAVYVRDLRIDAMDQAAVTDALRTLKMNIQIRGGKTFAIVNGADVTKTLRENDISEISSVIATYPAVREFMMKIMRDIAARESFILEGRDIAAAVLPDAKYKFYLTANVKTRARRRRADLAAKGTQISLREMIRQIKQRDRRDAKKGGLVRVRGAVVIDSTNMTNAQMADEFIRHIDEPTSHTSAPAPN